MISIKPIECNLNCPGCYEKNIRKFNNEYEFNKIFDTLKEYTEKLLKKLSGNYDKLKCENNPTLHGGEPLMMKDIEIETLLEYINRYWGHTGIQTNLLMLNENHIRMFKLYHTHVGVSLDGDTLEMNHLRNLNKNQLSKILINIKKLIDSKIRISLISVISKKTKKNLKRFFNFIKNFESVRLNPFISFNKDLDNLQLLEDDYSDFYIDLFKLCIINFKFQSINPFRDIIEMLMGHVSNSTCHYGECDSWATKAEIPIVFDGSLSNCMKTGSSQDGTISLRSEYEKSNKKRYEILQKIPQLWGGCKNCQWWYMCKGGCPGAGESGDYRNRTRFCEGEKYLFEYFYKFIKLIFPNIYLTPDFYPDQPDVDKIQKSISRSTWNLSKKYNFQKLISENVQKSSHPDHGDRPHGDRYLDSGKT